MGLIEKIIKESENLRNDRLMKLLSRRYFDYFYEHETPIESIKKFLSLSQVLEVLQN